MLLSLWMLTCTSAPALTGAVEVVVPRGGELVYSAHVGAAMPVGPILVGLDSGSRSTRLLTSGNFGLTVSTDFAQLRAAFLVDHDLLTPTVALTLKLGAKAALKATCEWLPTGPQGSVGITATPGPVTLALLVDNLGTVGASASFAFPVK